jgi:hypothetical protein
VPRPFFALWSNLNARLIIDSDKRQLRDAIPSFDERSVDSRSSEGEL